MRILRIQVPRPTIVEHFDVRTNDWCSEGISVNGERTSWGIVMGNVVRFAACDHALTHRLGPASQTMIHPTNAKPATNVGVVVYGVNKVLECFLQRWRFASTRSQSLNEAAPARTDRGGDCIPQFPTHALLFGPLLSA
jgi:hypothetical protein